MSTKVNGMMAEYMGLEINKRGLPSGIFRGEAYIRFDDIGYQRSFDVLIPVTKKLILEHKLKGLSVTELEDALKSADLNMLYIITANYVNFHKNMADEAEEAEENGE